MEHWYSIGILLVFFLSTGDSKRLRELMSMVSILTTLRFKDT